MTVNGKGTQKKRTKVSAKNPGIWQYNCKRIYIPFKTKSRIIYKVWEHIGHFQEKAIDFCERKHKNAYKNGNTTATYKILTFQEETHKSMTERNSSGFEKFGKN